MSTVPGLELSRAFFADVVRPLVHQRWPALPYAAACLGPGSEVLGLDDAMSRDHDWGPRLTLLVDVELGGQVMTYLEASLPESYAGRPTRFPTTADLRTVARVAVDSPGGFAASRLGGDPREGLSVADWLSLTGQSVLEVAGGEVFVDTEGALTALRAALTWYPDDLWRYLVACDWGRLDQELPLLGRAGHRGDDLGSRIIAARMVDTATHLGFLLERRWAPYPKWRGTVFASLPVVGSVLTAGLGDALAAGDWPDRQRHLSTALDRLLAAQGEAGLPSARRAVIPFHDRPYLQVAPEIVEELLEPITDQVVRRLPFGVGSIEQWCGNVDVLTHADRRRSAARSLLAHPTNTQNGWPAGSAST